MSAKQHGIPAHRSPAPSSNPLENFRSSVRAQQANPEQSGRPARAASTAIAETRSSLAASTGNRRQHLSNIDAESISIGGRAALWSGSHGIRSRDHLEQWARMARRNVQAARSNSSMSTASARFEYAGLPVGCALRYRRIVIQPFKQMTVLALGSLSLIGTTLRTSGSSSNW